MQMKEARQPDSRASVFSDLHHNTSEIPAAFTPKDASIVSRQRPFERVRAPVVASVSDPVRPSSWDHQKGTLNRKKMCRPSPSWLIRTRPPCSPHVRVFARLACKLFFFFAVYQTLLLIRTQRVAKNSGDVVQCSLNCTRCVYTHSSASSCCLVK